MSIRAGIARSSAMHSGAERHVAVVVLLRGGFEQFALPRGPADLEHCPPSAGCSPARRSAGYLADARAAVGHHRSIAWCCPAHSAISCICANVHTRGWRERLTARLSSSRIRTPRHGLPSAHSSVMASSASAESARRMPAGSLGGPLLDRQHVRDELLGVTSAQFVQRPVPQLAALELHVEHDVDPSAVGLHRPLGHRVLGEPSRQVLAERARVLRRRGLLVRGVDRVLGIALAGERSGTRRSRPSWLV